MSFTLEIGATSSPKNKIDKNFNVRLVTTGSLVAESSIINPVIRIDQNLGAGTGAGLKTCNYVHIEAFARFYYIVNITTERNGMTRLNLKVDPLKSFKEQIMNQEGIAERIQMTENSNFLLPDPMVQVRQRTLRKVVDFPKGFEIPTFVLALAGSRGVVKPTQMSMETQQLLDETKAITLDNADFEVYNKNEAEVII